MKGALKAAGLAALVLLSCSPKAAAPPPAEHHYNPQLRTAYPSMQAELEGYTAAYLNELTFEPRKNVAILALLGSDFMVVSDRYVSFSVRDLGGNELFCEMRKDAVTPEHYRDVKEYLGAHKDDITAVVRVFGDYDGVFMHARHLHGWEMR